MKAGIDYGQIFVALGDARGLLILGGHLRAVGVAGLHLKVNDIELLLRVLLLEGGDVGLHLEFGEGAAKAGLTVEGVDLGLLRIVEGARGRIGGLAGPGLARPIEDRQRDLDAEGRFIGGEVVAVELIEGLERVGECGVTIVNSEQTDDRAIEKTGVTPGLLLSGVGAGEG